MTRSVQGGKAIVYNEFMYVLGGGERSALAYARALLDLGFRAEILTVNPSPAPERIVSTFGEEFADIPVRFVEPAGLDAYLASEPISVFVNHTFMNFHPNPAAVGIYAQMFPSAEVRRNAQGDAIAYLDTYQRMSCISEFARQHTISRWDFPPERMRVLHPPLGRRFIRAARWGLLLPPGKQRRFVTLGRFNPGLHNKNQSIVIDAFVQARKRHAALLDWELVVVGNVNTNPASKAYYEECCRLAEPGGVRVLTDVPLHQLLPLLRESFGFVLGTGAFVDPQAQPEKCEHYGLAVAEGMAFGCIPLVYHAGGFLEVFDPERMGFSYSDRDQLMDGFARAASVFGTPQARKLQRANRLAAHRLSRRHFTRGLRQMIDDVVAGR